MKFSVDSSDAQFVIRSYRRGAVVINQEEFTHSLIVMPDKLMSDWSPQHFDELATGDFEMLADLQPEIVLLGTGAKIRFPPSHMTSCLLDRGIGLECMDTAAACRSYAVLASEGRQVAAALLMI